MAAVIPQISAAPQPPRSRTDQPSDPSRKPGIREADHEPVVPAQRLQELAFLNDCLSHALPPFREPSCGRGWGPRGDRNTRPGQFQWPCANLMALRALGMRTRRTIPYTMRRPPITIKCECGETEEVAYGERWRCERCGRSWNTQQIPAEEYEGLLRRMRRHKLEVLAAGGAHRGRPRAADRRRQLTLHRGGSAGDGGLALRVSAVLAAQVPPLGARRAALGAPPRLAC